jgi:phosphohistidine phosphatase
MQLVLLRHGIAQDRAGPDAPTDAERRLTPRGRRRTEAAAAGLRALGVEPRAVLSSPYVRAAETAAIALEALAPPGVAVVPTDALLPDAPPDDLPRVLQRLDAQCVLCAGHAPHLDLLIAHLLGAPATVTELKKAGAACLELGAGRSRLRWLLEPRTLRALGRG